MQGILRLADTLGERVIGQQAGIGPCRIGVGNHDVGVDHLGRVVVQLAGSLAGLQKAVQGVERALKADGRVLVRYSGTENKARVLVEGPDAKVIAAHADRIATELKKALG